VKNAAQEPYFVVLTVLLSHHPLNGADSNHPSIFPAQ